MRFVQHSEAAGPLDVLEIFAIYPRNLYLNQQTKPQGWEMLNLTGAFEGFAITSASGTRGIWASAPA